MVMKVPTFKEPGLTEWLIRMLEERDRSRARLLSSVTANHSVLLQSPFGKVYEITVADDGTIVRTLIAG